MRNDPLEDAQTVSLRRDERVPRPRRRQPSSTDSELSGSEVDPRPGGDATGTRTWRRPLPRLPQGLVIAAGVLALLSLGLPNIAPDVDVLAAPDSPVREFFGVAKEANLPTFFSVLVILAAASSQALVGRLVGGRVGRAFAVTSVLLLAMAFDDFVSLHERLDSLGAAVVPSGPEGYLWVLPGVLLALVVVAAFWQLGRSLRGPARRHLLFGIGVVFTAALGLETLNGYLDDSGRERTLQLFTHLEEFTENLGMIILLRGSLTMMQVSSRSTGFCLRIDDRSLAQG